MTQTQFSGETWATTAVEQVTAPQPCVQPVRTNGRLRTGGIARPVRSGLHSAAPSRANGHRSRNGHAAATEGTDDPIAMTREIMGHLPGAYVMCAQDDGLSDAQVHKGDVVLLQCDDTAANGELIAVRLLDEARTVLRRIYFENGHVRLQPEDRRQAPLIVAPSCFEIQGRVVAIIRHRP